LPAEDLVEVANTARRSPGYPAVQQGLVLTIVYRLSTALAAVQV
jgi:hypothetical protein